MNFKKHGIQNGIVKDLIRTFGILTSKRAFIGPKCVQIDSTRNCNLNCITCWTNSPLVKEHPPLGWRKKKLEYGLFNEIIKDLCNLKTDMVTFAGEGEPFFHPRIMDMITHVKEKGMRCAVTTNGSLIDKSTAKELVKLGLDYL